MIELVCQCGDPTCELGCYFGSSIKQKYPRLFKLFFESYVECALWAESCETEPDPEANFFDINLSESDLHEKTRQQMEKDCGQFLKKAFDLIMEDDDMDFDNAGHDFWLTRNGHGAGFWDGDWREGEKLTEIAKSFGHCYPYHENGQIYIE